MPTKGVRATSTFTVTIAGENGLTMSSPLVVAKGWAPMWQAPEGAYAPCSRVTWSYDAGGAAKGARTIERDIRASMKRLSTVTGLRFDQIPPGPEPADLESRGNGGAADINIGWDDLGAHGPSGTGSSDGTVTLNRKDWWVTDKYAGFGNRYRSPAGRGWLIIHEVMHTLWLDHVDSRTAIMGPINYGQHHFTRGDLEGLATLYPRTGCAA